MKIGFGLEMPHIRSRLTFCTNLGFNWNRCCWTPGLKGQVEEDEETKTIVEQMGFLSTKLLKLYLKYFENIKKSL